MTSDSLGEYLIFLISQPRSGSTLLQRILASHPSITTSAEPWIMLHPIYARRSRGIQAEFDHDGAYLALQEFLQNYAGGEETYLKSVRAFANTLYNAAREKTDAQFFLDKTPRYYLIIPELYQVFPEAHYVFIVRNPLSVLHSILSTWVSKEEWPDLLPFRDDLLSAPQKILDGNRQSGGRSILVKYEELVTEPESTTRRICEHIGVDFRPEQLDYQENSEIHGSFGDATEINKYPRPSKASLEKWKNLAATAQYRHYAAAYLSTLGREIVTNLGYDFNELSGFVDHASHERFQSLSVIPWSTALKPGIEWTRKERLAIRRSQSIQKNGTVIGLLKYVSENYRTILAAGFE